MHVLPAAGSNVWIRQRRWRVDRARADNGVVRLDVTGHDRRVTFLWPFDLPVCEAVQRRARRAGARQALARLAHLAAYRETAGMPMSAIDARVAVMPHQLEPALAVFAGARRVLIADEVGLGKTIQAGLVLAELQQRSPSLRALVVVPAALRGQWRGELASRFGLACMLADRHTIDAATRRGAFGDNPWTQPGIWVASLDYLRQPHVFSALPLSPWDVVVIDEAHDACGESERHAVADELARRARCVVLLTATPHSGDAPRFERLLALGTLPFLHDGLTIFRRTRAALGLDSTRRVRWVRMASPPREARMLDALADFERVVLAAAGDERRPSALLLLSVLRKRALSTARAFGASIDRRLAWLEAGREDDALDWIQPRLAFDEDARDDVSEDERLGLTADVGLPKSRERSWLRRLRTVADSARHTDRKIAWIAAIARRTREPFVVFTEFRDSLCAIAERLDRLRDVACLHGGQAPAERDAALHAFLDGGASVLVTTDVAGQGLNLQSRARWVVIVELPWNPTRLEQRIGRVDRLGQTKPVHASLLLSRHRAESGVLARLAARTLAARRSLGDNVLTIGWPPADLSVANLVLDGTERPAVTCDDGSDDRISADTTARLPLCHAWRCRARAVARQLERRRALARRWLGPAVSLSQPRWTLADRVPALGVASGAACVICVVPLLDASGAAVERRVFGVWTDAATGLDPWTPEWRSCLKRVLATRLEARARRLERAARQQDAARADIERAIAGHLAATMRARSAQPGLFDGRLESRASESVSEENAKLVQDADARTCVTQATIHGGEPVIVLVFTSRP